MYGLLHFLLTFTIITLVSVDITKQFGDALPSDKFGPVNPRVTEIKFCRGPKTKNCSENTYTNFGDNLTNVTYKFDLKENSQLSKMKVAMWTNKPGPDFVQWIDKPCAHFVFGLVLDTYMKPSRNCIVSKGTYVVNINTTAFLLRLYGDNFYYGKSRSTLLLTSKDCNLVCLDTHFEFEPKRKTN